MGDVALYVIDAEFVQAHGDGLRLHTLGDTLHVEGFGHAHDGLHHHVRAVVGQQVAREAAVDLHAGDGQTLEVGHGVHAGAEIIE